MGKLFDDCQYVMHALESTGADMFKARGAIALETGFLMSAVRESDPDDLAKMEALRAAALRLFDIKLPA